MMFGDEAGLPTIPLAVRDKKATWAPTEALLDSGGGLSLAGQDMKGLIDRRDCEGLRPPKRIKSIAGQLISLFYTWTATLRFGPSDDPVEAKVTFYVAPDYRGKLLLGVDAIRRLEISIGWKALHGWECNFGAFDRRVTISEAGVAT